jgi:hypothetical protein
MKCENKLCYQWVNESGGICNLCISSTPGWNNLCEKRQQYLKIKTKIDEALKSVEVIVPNKHEEVKNVRPKGNPNRVGV